MKNGVGNMEIEQTMTVDYEDIASVFSYEMYDRQMKSFIAMWDMLIGAWDDYGTRNLRSTYCRSR